MLQMDPHLVSRRVREGACLLHAETGRLAFNYRLGGQKCTHITRFETNDSGTILTLKARYMLASSEDRSSSQIVS